MIQLRESQRHSSCTGNNAHDHQHRMSAGSSGRVWIPGLISGSVSDVVVGTLPVFEEVIDDRLTACPGLEYHCMTSFGRIPVVIVDNHNYVLPHRRQLTKDLGRSFGTNQSTNQSTNILPQSAVSLIHIDQHADMNEPDRYLDDQDMSSLDALFDYTRDHTTIASFIRPAIQAGWIRDCIQVRSSSALSDLQSFDSEIPFVLDIDLDFRDPRAKYSLQEMEMMICVTQELMSQAHLITIATSPLFIDQEYALGLLRRLLAH